MPMARSDRALAPTEAAGPRSEGAGARVTVFEVATARCHAGPRVIVRAGLRSATCAKGSPCADQLARHRLCPPPKLFSLSTCSGGISAMKRLGMLLIHRSEEHTSELQSLMRISYAVFCLKKKQNKQRLKTAHI